MKKTLKTLLYGSIFALASLLPYKVHAAEQFIRGDTNQDEIVDISDSINTLEYLFLGKEKPECMDAADVDDSGIIDTTDAVYTLEHLFLGGQKPPAPFPNTGYDVTRDGLDCKGQGDLEARIIMQRDIPLVITESGTPERPLVYVLGEDVIAEGTAIEIREVSKINFYGNFHSISYGDIDEGNGVFIKDANNINIKDLKISDRGKDHGSGIRLQNSHFINMENNIITTFGEENIGINSYLSNNIHVLDNIIKTANVLSYGMEFENSNDLMIYKNSISNSGSTSDAIIIERSKNSRITNNIINNVGIYSPGLILIEVTDSYIVGNDIRSVETGLGIGLSSNLVLEDNNIETIGEFGDGIFFENSNKNINFYGSFIKTRNINSHGIRVLKENNNINFLNSEILVDKLSSYYIKFDDDSGGLLNFIDTKFDINRIYLEPESKGIVRTYQYFNARITDITNNPLERVFVEGYDTNNNPIFSEYTNQDGRILRRELLSYTQDKDGIKQAYPYTIKVSKPGYQTKNDIFDLTGNVDLRYVLEPASN
ncbi:right-handed parallel beta-helix repeat-containing protein [Candidatus Pacearchaeota archaeon]|nr:right-handed parallel beta-helix repeat-containing protein [Candidatus Pacearchaeota archaeon]